MYIELEQVRLTFLQLLGVVEVKPLRGTSGWSSLHEANNYYDIIGKSHMKAVYFVEYTV